VWFGSFGVGRGLTNVRRSKVSVLHREWMDSLERPTQWERDVRFGPQKVKNLCTVSSLETVANEMAKCTLDLVVVQGS
jgi:hypothetical protein